MVFVVLTIFAARFCPVHWPWAMSSEPAAYSFGRRQRCALPTLALFDGGTGGRYYGFYLLILHRPTPSPPSNHRPWFRPLPVHACPRLHLCLSPLLLPPS